MLAWRRQMRHHAHGFAPPPATHPIMFPSLASNRTGPRCRLTLLLALACAACAPPSLIAYRPDAPLTANLPLAAAGIRDERAAFASAFERELRTANAAPAIEDWLHLADLAAGAAQARHDDIDRRFLERRETTLVLVVTGMFGDCIDDQSVPFGDGAVRTPELEATASYLQYADLGLREIRSLRLPGRASAQSNGELLAAAVRETAARADVARIVLVGYSKGVTDALHALAALDAAGGVPPKLAALVSVAGVVMGTPLADHFEGVYDSLSPHLSPFGCSASAGGEMASLTRRERVRWMAAHRLPASLAYYSVVAFAAPEQTVPLLRRSQTLLASIDPRNDGQLAAGDAILPGSVLLAAARTDHWGIALPLQRNPHVAIRAFGSGRPFPRAALFRALLRWVIGSLPQ